MGSDLNYEDMMRDKPLQEEYKADVTAEDVVNGRKCWVLTLTAIVPDVNYYSQKLWVDKEQNVVLQSQQFAKSGKLLKQINFSDVKKVQGRWYPMTFVYKDALKNGKGTKLTITNIQLDGKIPDAVFNKANLK
jgi:outer membrane lipoprotein-sorting protein